MKKIFTLIVLFFQYLITAQGVGIDTAYPHNDAILDINSTGKGVLLTRLELITADNPSPLANHVMGIITYNTANSPGQTPISVSEGMYYNDGTKWNLMGPNTVMLGDLKHSLETSDHKGWFKLDGRSKTSLPALAQYNATAIGIGSDLPDMADKFLKTNKGSETQGSTAGSNTITLTQPNLPNVTYNTTTTTDGNHNHTYSDSYNGPKTLGLATNVLPLVPLFNETVGINDAVPANLYATANAGSHSHTVTVPSGGIGTPINATPKHIVTNVFIFLGE